MVVAGCTRTERTIELKPAFSDDTIVGALTVRWMQTGADRPSGATGAPEREVQYEIDALNRLADPVFVRITDVQLVGQGGAIGTGQAPIACALEPGPTAKVVRGSVWVPATQASGVRDARLKYVALPLSERGRAFQREFLLRQRPGAAAAIDAELDTYAGAPTCRGQ